MTDNRFHFLTGDIDYRQYGGKWYRKIHDTIYHVIELINMWDATGEYEQEQYNVNLQEINLEIADIDSALSCCGCADDMLDNPNPLMLVESVSTYGQYAPMGNWNGNNYRQLLKSAREESHRLTDDYDYHESQVSRPVNLLGSTAYEFAQGDFTSAMIRGIAKGDKSARIIGKIHGLNESDLNNIANDDSLKDFSLYG